MSGMNTRKELLRLSTFVRPRLVPYLAGLFGAGITASAAGVFTAFVLRDLLQAATRKDAALLKDALVLICAIVAGLCVLAPILNYMFKSSVKRTMADIRQKLYQHIEGMKVSYFESEHSGDTISRMTNDINIMEAVISDFVYAIVFTVMSGASSAVTMLILDWRLGLILLALGGLSACLNLFFAAPIRRLSDSIQQKRALLTERLSDLINGFSIMKMFHISGVITGKFDRVNVDVTKDSLARVRIEASQEGGNFLLSWLNFGGIMLVGSVMALYGSVDFGNLAAILQLSNSVTFALQNIGGILAQMQEALAGAGRVMELLEAPAEEEGSGRGSESGDIKAEDIKSTAAALELRDVHFSYEEDNRVLEGLSIKADRGQAIALVGPSGCGKSTVIKLLMGFYSPDSGSILLNGRDIREYTLSGLRDITSYVSQDSYLFDGTIEENIRYGRFSASREEVMKAAILANAHGFITEQPDSYCTVVGERGVRLSGGQRQRIAIARAILKDAPVLLLDEATSALDSESEQEVQDAINRLMKGRTTVVVAHRLSTVEKADIIYVIKEGRVIEKGTHDQLSTGSGLYRKLYELQFSRQEAAVTSPL